MVSTAAAAISPHSLPRPQLRVVLMCDLADSTALVERLGDHDASELLRHHDALFRDLLARHDGQEIDRADGFLALFARPVQAVAFALAYQRAIASLPGAGTTPLRARVGIHLGEVIVWDNAPETIAAGARQFNAEGLAKPVAARLMALAEPGQVLLSEVACALAQRAQNELADGGDGVSWEHHGAYRFKGVSAPMQVYEVGERGRAPLRSPHSGYKARRVLPAWQRYVLGAVPVLGLVVLVLVISGLLKPTPAIAFRERDWVVMGSVNNQTGDVRFDDSLQTALRIALDQSRYVNVLSELRVRDTLARMTRKENTPLDRALGSEVAIREGARALVLPSVAEIGGRLRLSVEVVDPRTQTTVFAETADGVGAESAFTSIDRISQSLRKRLGEPIQAIAQADAPTAKVTSANLDAVRAFSLALEARSEARNDEARLLLQHAVELDPDFAMAYVRLAFIAFLANDSDGAHRYLELAQTKRARLSDREALLLDASLALFEKPEVALQRWKLLATMYPDEYRAFYNFSYFAHHDAQQYQAALDFLPPALASQNPARRNAYYLLGGLNLALDRTAEALKAFEQADALGVRGYKREKAETFAVLRNYAEAERVLAAQESNGNASEDVEQRLGEITIPLDQGRWGKALSAATVLEAVAEKASPLNSATYRGIRLSLRSYDPDPAFNSDLRAYLKQQTSLLANANALDRRHLQFQVLASGWMAAYSGDPDTARVALAAAGDAAKDSGFPANQDIALVLQAELNLADGRPEAAVLALASRATQGNALYFLHAVLMRALARSKQYEEALQQAEWLATHRGRAFGEHNSLNLWQSINVLESNLALLTAARYAEQLGQVEAAQKYHTAFAQAWPGAEQLAVVKRRATQ